MRLTLTSVGMLMFTLTGASTCTAQTRLPSVEMLQNALAPGDLLTIVLADGRPVAGRLMRLGDADLDLRVLEKHTTGQRRSRNLTLPLDAIQWLERRRDSARNGAAIGAAIGAGFGAAMFTYAYVVDRNEVDEWAPSYVGAAVACTGIGALIGWAIDAARSKPHITFARSSERRTKVEVQPVYLRGRGFALAVSF